MGIYNKPTHSKQSSDNFQYSKAMSNIFQRKKLVKSMSPAHHLERSLCRSKFASKCKNHKVEICGENCLSSPYLLKASLYPCKRVNNFILLQNFFNYESSNLIYVVICQIMQRRIDRRKRSSSERANKSLQNLYKASAISRIGS